MKKFIFFISLLSLSVFMVACGESSKNTSAKENETGKEVENETEEYSRYMHPGEVEEITLEEVRKKMNNRDSFWLIALTPDPKRVQEKRVIEFFQEELKKKGLAAYYVNLHGLSEEELKELGRENPHYIMDQFGADGKWSVEFEPIVYVQDGAVLSFGGESILPRDLERKDDFSFEARKSLSFQLNKLDYYGVDWQ